MFLKLTKSEREIISKFYNSNLNEYSLTYVTILETNKIYYIVLNLIKRNIFKERTIMKKGYGVKYKLTNMAWKN